MGENDRYERARLYELADTWLGIARSSYSHGDYQGERIAWDYLREIIAALNKGE